MSAFLGPIHYWLYNKIKLQDDFVALITQYAKENQLSETISKSLDETFGVLEDKPLEEIIDASNIHGWLQEKVSMVEGRFAFAVTKILKQAPDKQKDLEDIMFAYGTKQANTEKASSVNDVFTLLNDVLLDGMPCDHVNEVISEDETEVVWKRSRCIHSIYWERVSGDVKHYYALRDAFIKGLLQGTNISFERFDDIYCKLVDSRRAS